eukprot:6747180-Lingulodinium_polyedra.AAC.1
MGKPTTDVRDPLFYRLIMVLGYLYRCWAKLRLGHLRPWMQSWAAEDTMAIWAGTGAGAAWMR